MVPYESFVLFLKKDADYRDLHSFPTRRSSDLELEAHAGTQFDAEAVRTMGRTASASNCVRSEEHTSELQSRFDLVCRLLLEKKKNRRLCFEHGASMINFILNLSCVFANQIAYD